MNLKAFPFQQRPCAQCASPVDSTFVYTTDPENHGKSFVFYDCGMCGQLAYRALGFDIANLNGNNFLTAEPLTSREEIEAVTQAALGQ